MTNAQISPATGEHPPVVLVVEDEALVRMVICEALREQGFTVVEAVNAEEALAVLAAGILVDIVFTDVRMPGAFDGLELVKRIKQQRPTLPVLVTSGHLDRDSVGEVAGFFPKPYRLADVIAVAFSLARKGSQE